MNSKVFDKEEDIFCSCFDTPIGTIEMTANNSGISSLFFLDENKNNSINSSPLLIDAENQLKEYFAGTRKEFNLKIDLQGTKFQQMVWNKLLEIPFGMTISYLQLAKKIGNTKSIRAAGGANARNPLSIIVPCHRVIGNDGSLTGYGGGLWRKEWLLKHENKWFENNLFQE